MIVTTSLHYRAQSWPSTFKYFGDIIIVSVCVCVYMQESHTSINPHGIVAIGPELDFSAPHDRATKFN